MTRVVSSRHRSTAVNMPNRWKFEFTYAAIVAFAYHEPEARSLYIMVI